MHFMEHYQQALLQAFPESDVTIEGGGAKFIARVISDAFAGKNKVARHRAVYGVLQEYIASGEIHALNIEALTPDEAASQRQ